MTAKKSDTTGSEGSNRTWGGRFSRRPSERTQAFTASIGFDIRLLPYDIRAGIAHAEMLAAQKIIPAGDRDAIVKGLRSILIEFEQGRFTPTLDDEDVHMAVERRLIEIAGKAGARLHTARSRNDQVVTDVRLYMKDAIAGVDAGIAKLQKTLIDVARKHEDAILPGYTHMQRAQPVLLGHHLLAYYDMLARDRARLADCLRRLDVLALGAGALAGTTLPIDPKHVAKSLGFARVSENSIDAVADRDFILEYLSAIAILFAHISRWAGEITLWATSEFRFVLLDDAYSTGSSMMPQKKNPDIAELVRGKSGRVYGNLLALLTAIKGLPLAYNSDLQEDKEPLFDSTDSAIGSLEQLSGLTASLSFDIERMADAGSEDLMLATDLAEYLVGRGVPFRDAHEVCGSIVAHVIKTGTKLTELDAATLSGFSDAFEADAAKMLDPRAAVARRTSPGGTSGSNLKKRLRKLVALALAATLGAAITPACGVRTSPRPPEDTNIAMGTVKAERTAEGGVKVRWRRPKTSADGTRLRDLTGFVVARRSGAGEFRDIALVPVEDNRRVRPQQTFTFVDTDAPRIDVQYRVRAFDSHDQHGTASPIIEVVAPTN